MIKRALLSVWFKDGLVELGGFLADKGVELVSTGGTAKVLTDAGLTVTPVEKLTGTGAVMDGRVKTLDPRIFGGILADRNNPDHLKELSGLGGAPIDLVVVNCYPFGTEAVEKALELRDAIEYIDIGGPSMLRAAAKNYHCVVALSHPSQYVDFMEQFQRSGGDIPLESRRHYAAEVFRMTAGYDAAIRDYLGKTPQEPVVDLKLDFVRSAELRYGENPHQKAAFYLPKGTDLPWKQHQGKALSYNNYADMESAVNIAREFKRIACCIVKHANPCGFGFGASPIKAYRRAITTDPVSYFGGIVGFNRQVDGETARELIKSFLECIIAPDYSKEALSIFSSKKNLRIVTVNQNGISGKVTYKSVAGGLLYQEKDGDQGELNHLKVVTKRGPTADESDALRLGWKLVRYVKSNAIVFTDPKQLLGVGAGQMSRVDSVLLAMRKAHSAGLKITGAAMASDAFFPFPDGIEVAAKAGVTAVIQPGGSIRDREVIRKADDLELAMVFTNVRHFYH
ncbi:MAG: bifunctional phosphoribosylaminoimidazolecarboxamide formyltransferase/IMP cyclohydrolase [FCB group bacterium]|nr:bifunctional phosphoribosylaminoimidazolecarboxamide formyltransferase/IMP cyclohydrolase [FCB group bacterium]